MHFTKTQPIPVNYIREPKMKIVKNSFSVFVFVLLIYDLTPIARWLDGMKMMASINYMENKKGSAKHYSYIQWRDTYTYEPE